ncbi:protein suppressor of white apricot [Anthonomus grandis grandis]|uniref:protein suppressor of white apricot n=1 Tax=Anthonomus grandis grandis TaxID=2921223 RepID=UPI00216508AD|nr:protein suppressor of white apricot [Anthonomus grandis grandis]
MSQWGSSDSGILRKNRVEENLDQLLVFGYSCKIFRDNEKALYIDQGKHLIPWMGQDSLKIDRYDCRGALSDLKQYEASREGYDTLRWMGLNESEKKLEELCDAERYYSLEINEEEEEMYKEEAAKRNKTNAISFDYNTPQPHGPEPQEPLEGIPTVPEKEEEDEPYVPLPVLDVPVDINMPKTVKEYARIEKTALFVCRQGLQMEILIKAKQADNPQFSFLIVQDPLYKFYRHLLQAFKNGRYQPQCSKKIEEPKPVTLQEDETDAHYLHPSLQSSTAGKPATPPPPANPGVRYRPSADCAYSQLVSRIQGAGGHAMNGQSEYAQQQPYPAMDQAMLVSLEQQYHQYYYVQQFYEYWRHSVISSEQGGLYAGLPPNFNQLDQNMQSYIHQLAWGQFVQHHQQQQAIEAQQAQQAKANNNAYSQIVSNLNKDGVSQLTANIPQLPPPEPKTEKPVKLEEKPAPLVKYEDNEVKKPLLSLTAYGSGSDTDSQSDSGSEDESVEEKVEVYRVPPSEVQTVIDKMAEYVSKNGDQFEEIIKQKGDSRFDFLNGEHEFYKYYKAKLRELKGAPVEKKEPKKAKIKVKKVIAPVCFSIKKPKDEPSKEIKSALPMEDSSEEEQVPKSPENPITVAPPKIVDIPPDQTATETNSNTIVSDLKEVVLRLRTKSPPTKEKSRSKSPPKRRSRSPPKIKIKEERTSKSPNKSPPQTKSPNSPKRINSSPKKRKSPPIDMFADDTTIVKKPKQINGLLEIKDDDPILEMMEIKREQQKIADEQEKARQLERKRKAAMFLKLKSVENMDKGKRSPGKKKILSSPSTICSSRRNSEDSIISVRSRSSSREKRDRSRSRSRSRSRRKDSRKHKKHKKERSRSRDSRKRRKEKKKSHKRKRSKSKRKSKKHKRSRSRSRSRSPSSRSRSKSVASHISINDSP